jgi:hypothetical protein
VVKHDPKRSRNAVQTSVMLSREAREILDELVPSGYGAGKLLSMLLVAERARSEERQRLVNANAPGGGTSP